MISTILWWEGKEVWLCLILPLQVEGSLRSGVGAENGSSTWLWDRDVMEGGFLFSSECELLGRWRSAEVFTAKFFVELAMFPFSEGWVFTENPYDTMGEEIPVRLGMEKFDVVNPLRICHFTDVWFNCTDLIVSKKSSRTIWNYGDGKHAVTLITG